MSTDKRLRTLGSRGRKAAGLLAGLVVLITLYLAVRPFNASLANGALGGGLVGLGGVAIAFLRGGRPSATSIERGMSGLADERDASIAQHAFAFAGKVALLWMGSGVIAIGVGADPAIASAAMIWGQLLSLVGAWIFYSSRL